MSSAPTVTVLKPNQELFLLLIVEQGLSATEAYGKTYLRAKEASWGPSSSRLLCNVRVQQRKTELERAKAMVARASTRVTADFISQRLFAVYNAAMESKQLAAASAALMGAAKLHGFLVEKHQVDAIVRRPSLNPDGPDMITEDQWLQEFGPIVIEHNSTAQPEVAEQHSEDVPLERDTTDDGTAEG